ncbi:MAG: S-adenosylmethionine:tRNA ribosyltransferase-isomerase, partial [Magnetococcales bacterium]|nr:S-adenosylmethionine:tRNA ribosyltransferase-isomerase [Magnetococcales bacterium]
GLLQQLTRQGVATTNVTLHVGLGTFQPVRDNDISHHTMHAEWCSLSATTAEKIYQTRQQGGRIIAVGTTVTRVLESATPTSGHTEPFEGETRIFILPGYEYKAIDGLITNFHLPKSTLLMLVAAFIGKQRMDQVYQHAIARDYRFYSYGDASLLLP